MARFREGWKSVMVDGYPSELDSFVRVLAAGKELLILATPPPASP